jgi:hypothetical protein
MDEQKKEESEKIHDWLTPIEKTSVQLASIVLSRLVDKFDDLVYENVGLTDEQKKHYEEIGTDFCISILDLMASTDIPADYATRSVDKLIEALTQVKNYIDGTITKYDDEILSRLFEVKSPVTGTYMRDVATLGTIMLKLQEIINKTGNKPDDYFIIKK